MASLPPESPIATCRSALDSWLDCDVRKAPVFSVMEEFSSDAEVGFTAPITARKTEKHPTSFVRIIVWDFPDFRFIRLNICFRMSISGFSPTQRSCQDWFEPKPICHFGCGSAALGPLWWNYFLYLEQHLPAAMIKRQCGLRPRRVLRRK